MSDSNSATADKYADYSREQLLAEICRLKKNKKYGLVWEHKKEDVIENFETQQPYLEEVADKRIEDTPGEPTNLIIEGDNFDALSILNYTHAGKVDVIYIDPPYNTGNKDFIYNDNYVDSEDEFRHSKWLSFMEPRLKLAKNLLKNDGVIIISIDDIEQSPLKMLCDEIFGSNNFISMITVENGNGVFGAKAANANKAIIKVKDYALVYSKTTKEKTFNLLYSSSDFFYDSHYNRIIKEDGGVEPLIGWLKKDKSIKAAFGKRGLAITSDNIDKLMRIDDSFREKMQTELADMIVGDWPYTATIDDESIFDDGNYHEINGIKVFRTSGGKYRWYRSFSSVVKVVDDYIPEKRIGVIRGDLWKGFYKDMTNISKEGGIEFRNGKKPERLIRQFVKCFGQSNEALILDFFAGSGTTGQAVLELNKEDGGHRQFILCTNNGDRGPDSVKIAEEITYPRVKTVITGKRQDGSKYSDGIPANLRYYKINHREKKPSIDANRQDIVVYMEDIIQVKENAFKQLDVNGDYALYESAEKCVGMVFEPFSLEEIIKKIKEKNTDNRPVKLYVFSYSRDAFEDNYDTDFEIEFVAMPEGLLKTYAHIIEEQKKEDL